MEGETVSKQKIIISELETLNNSNKVNIEVDVFEKGVIKSELLDINKAQMEKTLKAMGDADYTEDDVDCNKFDVNLDVEQRLEESKIDIKEEIISENTSIVLRDEIIFEKNIVTSTKIKNEIDCYSLHNIKKEIGNKGVLICGICNMSYRRKSTLLRHIQNHATKISGTHCESNNKVHLKKHNKARHTKIIAYKCSFCNYKASDKSTLDGHVNEIHSKLLKCIFPSCKFKTSDKSNLKNHINSQHTISLTRPRYFFRSSHYKTHDNKNDPKSLHTQLAEVNESNKGLEINIKEENVIQHTSSALQDEYDNDMKSDKIETENEYRAVNNTIKTYGGRGLFICDICNTRFRYKSTLIPHIRAHALNFNCTHCDYKTGIEAHLKKHINAKHTILSYKCSICVYKAYDKNALDDHMIETHLKGREEKSERLIINIKDENVIQQSDYNFTANSVIKNNTCGNIGKFVCDICNKYYLHKSTLKIHIEEKHNTSISCSYCKYTTKRFSHLRSHIKAVHLKNIVRFCPYCSYTTFLKDSLTRHVKCKHNRDSDFACTLCNFRSYFRASAINHFKENHNSP